MKYHIVVTRDGDGWMADVHALPGTHTWAKTLRALDRNAREVIGMVLDLPRSAEAALDLEMEYHTGDPALDERADRLRARRREQERTAAEIASDTSELLRRFAAQLPASDAAVLLGVSKGRISQLRSGAMNRTGTDGLGSSRYPRIFRPGPNVSGSRRYRGTPTRHRCGSGREPHPGRCARQAQSLA